MDDFLEKLKQSYPHWRKLIEEGDIDRLLNYLLESANSKDTTH